MIRRIFAMFGDVGGLAIAGLVFLGFLYLREVLGFLRDLAGWL